MEAQSTVQIPRVAIRFCTQCKWNLRAAYYAQELLQTFSTSIGEISLIPVTGGIFNITLYHLNNNNERPSSSTTSTTSRPPTTSNQHLHQQEQTEEQTSESTPSRPTSTSKILETKIWDRTIDKGFPETKELKNRIRNVIDPGRDMGHIDRSLNKGKKADSVEPISDGLLGDTKGKGKGQGGEEQTREQEQEQNEVKKKEGKEEVCEDCK